MGIGGGRPFYITTRSMPKNACVLRTNTRQSLLTSALGVFFIPPQKPCPRISCLRHPNTRFFRKNQLKTNATKNRNKSWLAWDVGPGFDYLIVVMGRGEYLKMLWAGPGRAGSDRAKKHKMWALNGPLHPAHVPIRSPTRLDWPAGPATHDIYCTTNCCYS